jgi:hypothetical protein
MGSEPQPLQTPSLPQVLAAALDAALEDVHTCSWGSVLSYDAASQTCSVQIIQRRPYTDEDGARQTERPAPLLEVPVLFMGAGAYSITWPLIPGDVVLLLFMERAMDAWHASGQTDVDAGDDRRHSLSDAIAVPGLRSRKNKIDTPPSDAMVLTGPKIQLGSKNASNGVLTTSDGTAFIEALAYAIAQSAAVPAQAPGTAALTNLYNALTSGASPPTSPPTPGGAWPTGSSKVKADD